MTVEQLGCFALIGKNESIFAINTGCSCVMAKNCGLLGIKCFSMSIAHTLFSEQYYNHW